jgi:hypothetical protein
VPQAGQLSLQAETETSNTVLSFADGSWASVLNWNGTCTKAAPILWLRLSCLCSFKTGLSGPQRDSVSYLPSLINFCTEEPDPFWLVWTKEKMSKGY